MSNSQQMYDTAFRTIMQNCVVKRVTQVRNLAWFVAGLIVARHCQLTRIVEHLPWASQHESRVQRLRRVLMNIRLDVRTVYGPTVGYLMEWLSQAGDLTLVIDRTMIENRLNVLMVSVAVHHRTLPLVWKVQKKPGSFQLRYIKAALRFVAAWAPRKAHIWVVGDREFQDVAFQTFVRDEVGWHFVQRLDQSTGIYPRGRRAFKLRQSGLRPGDYRSWGRVQVTHQRFGWVELMAYWRPGEDEPWYLISDKTVGRYGLKLYQRRLWTEHTFRDFKSHGRSLEDSELSHPQRFERLVLMIALAYVWLVQIGASVIKRGLRRWVDHRSHRTLSYFRLGLNWLNRLLACGREVNFPIYALGSPK